ncbi:radical SAM protein [Streptomyces sp. NBC_00250]|uniref:radical SAM protein n=1 Tax=Streptomyces sp. NBC_00250 TaxID=2903641 RepID=UPI002E2A1125|nr:radical SAM protein [Streptomyces sp. NBC_00250]
MSISADSSGHTKEAFQEELLASFSDDFLHLIILPTEQCNFRCTYCYEDFAIGQMDPSTVQGIKRLLDRRMDGLQRVSVSWFGGEPLLGRGVVEDVSAHIAEAAARRPGLGYEADMTTNGYLLDLAMAEKLMPLGVRTYQISLDGPETVHNASRVRANGGGSFQRIWNNLLSIRASKLTVRVILRVHLAPDTLPYMPDFLAQVRDTFLDDERFSVSLRPIERMGGPNDESIDVLSASERVRIIEDLKAVLSNGPSTSRETGTMDVCYAARPNSFVIRANGNIAKCTVALNDPANSIGHLLPDGTLQIDNEQLTPWVRGWARRDEDSVRCPYVGMPRSAPPLLQISSGPRSRADARS